MIKLNHALNKPNKCYGLSELGVIGGALIGLLAWLKFGMTSGLLAALLGYAASSVAAEGLHKGVLQRFIYWYLAFLPSLFGNKYLPRASKKWWL